MHRFTLVLNTSPYQAPQEKICDADSPNNTLLCKFVKDGDDDELYMTFTENYISLDSFEAVKVQNLQNL